MSQILLTDVRSKFLDYFKKNNHQIVDSSNLVPNNDPTLMFTNSGMVQFKNVFTGLEKKPFKTAVTSQKCVRAGGKHNDLENVGYTPRHHTFFEMLGNFSFGDYFKEQAITYAWNLLTKDFGLSKEKLSVTVYHEDNDSFNLWKKIAGLSEDKIIKISTSDNFWSMGDTGPCGPCSEIFYDNGEKLKGGPPGCSNQDGPTYQTVQGSTLLANSSGSDFGLLRLTETIPELYDVNYAGWDATGNTPSTPVCIHHPSGDIKKITFDYDNASNAGNFWDINSWDDGTTEPGSSGSPLFDGNSHRIVGQLYGGIASCTNW